jgi:hypothetical protein
MSGAGDVDSDPGGAFAAGAPAGADDAGRPQARPARAVRRAQRLLRWYPRIWRERYEEEFAELLIAEMEERPRSAARTIDVVRGGIVARLTLAGLAGAPVPGAAADPRRQVRVSLGTLGAALAVCLAFGAAMWSQLTIAWEWASPADATPPTMRATLVMSAAMLTFVAVAALAVLPILVAVARNFSRRLACPALVLLVAVVVLAGGGHHFGNGWPGTGGHGEDGSVFPVIPAGLQAFAWALSLSITSFWAHPAALMAMPGAERYWMVDSAIALGAATVAAAMLVRRVELSPRLLAYETGLAALATAVMGVFLGGCAYWVCVGRGPGLVHAGLIDVVGAAVLAIALALALQAQRTALRSLRLARR